MIKLWRIELLMFFCGIFWEYIAPMFRANTVSDTWDMLAYMIGGFLYWIITKKEMNIKKSEKDPQGFWDFVTIILLIVLVWFILLLF